jgi:hypothetical protein
VIRLLLISRSDARGPQELLDEAAAAEIAGALARLVSHVRRRNGLL